VWWPIDILLRPLGLAVSGALAVLVAAWLRPTWRPAVGYTLGLAWLVFLYALTPWLAVGSLSSMQFRADVEAVYGETIDTFWRLSNQLRDKREAARAALDADAQSLRVRRGALEENEARVEELRGQLIEMAVRNGIDVGKFADLATWRGLCDAAGSPLNGAARTTCVARDPLYAKWLYHIDTGNVRKMKVEEATRTLAASSEKFLALSAEDPFKNFRKKDQLLSAGDIATRLSFMDSWNYDQMLEMPDSVLILILTMAMGALGSTITMTWTFLSGDHNPSLRWYLIRPLVGAVSALVIFVFAKAGQMALTANGSEAQLDPYLISFVGVVAGLLSDQAYSRMATLGGNFLGQVDVQPSRWASGLDQHVGPGKAVDSATLAQHLGLDQAHLDRVLARQERATYAEQRRIADSLRVPLFRLFTDTAEA
jgi:hypothetical protein